MDVLSHFRSIEELTKTLAREQVLLSEMFEKRKLMKFPFSLALSLVGGHEARLRKLLDYGVLVETGTAVEIESDYLNFFEEVLNVNEEISVLSVQECINTLREHIGYFLQETNVHRKAGYQDAVRQLLKKTGFRTLKNVVDLKRNMDYAYKQEPNYVIKKKKLQHLDDKSHSIRSMIRECEKLMDHEQAFFLMANDPHMAKTCSDVKHDFVEAYHALMEIDRQIIVYLNQIDQQNKLYKKNEYEMKEAELKSASRREQERLEEERRQMQTRMGEIDELLAHLEGSLYTWLCTNVEGWEDTLGKVVDEKRVLYASGLEPQRCAASDSFFGVKLNLEGIHAVPRTPDAYRAEKKELEEQWQQVSRQLRLLPVSLEENCSKLGKKYAEKLNPLRQLATLLKVEMEQLPVKRQNLENQRHRLEMEEQELIAQERESRELAFNAALLKVESEKEARTKQEAKNKKDLKELDAAFIKEDRALEESLRLFKESQQEEGKKQEQEFETQLKQLAEQHQAELAGRGVDVQLLNQFRRALDEQKALLARIEKERTWVIKYQDAQQNLFDKEPEIKKEMKDLEQKLVMLHQRYEDKRTRLEKKRQDSEECLKRVVKELTRRREGLLQYRQMADNEHLVPDTYLSDDRKLNTDQDSQQLLGELRGTVNQKRESMEMLKGGVVNFNRYFKPQNAFHFNTMPVTDQDYLQIAMDLQEFMDNNKIEEFRRRTSEHYKDILGRISTEIGGLLKRRSDVDKVIMDINRDFVEKNFAGVIKSIELRADESSDKLMQLLKSIHDYTVDNAMSMGELNLFSCDNRDEVNRKVVDYLKSLSHQLLNEPARSTVSLGDAFRLQFRVKENDNDTNWVERINNVGSDGTDILVKAMVNIMLINVFKKKAVRKSGDFIVHCMMDEIGRLHPNNIKGILQFANSRNIYLINSSPTSYNPYDYRYTYLLSKQGVKTRVDRLLKRTFKPS